MKTQKSVLLIVVLFIIFGINSAINAQNKESKAKAPVKTGQQISKKHSENLDKVTDIKDTKTETSINSSTKEKKTDKPATKKSHNEMVHHKMMKDESKMKEKEKTTKENK
jgi:hypothetical protein